mgnify:CR=1 FL=1
MAELIAIVGESGQKRISAINLAVYNFITIFN